jgi:hypothetical protein
MLALYVSKCLPGGRSYYRRSWKNTTDYAADGAKGGKLDFSRYPYLDNEDLQSGFCYMYSLASARNCVALVQQWENTPWDLSASRREE